MKTPFLLLTLVMLALSIACARAPQTPTKVPPTPTTIIYPATWTPETTPLPPTATPRPPTRTPDPATLEVIKGFERTRGVRVYHATMDVVLNDPSGAMARSIPGLIAGDSLVLLSMDGRQNYDDSSWKLKGFILTFLSGSPEDEIEFLAIGDRLYLNGPLPLFGATQDRWYYAPKSASDTLANTNPNNMIGEFSGSDLNMPTMHLAAAEGLDGKKCSKYSADEGEAAEFFMSLDEDSSLKENLGDMKGAIERGVLNVWVCEDGYVHKMELALEVSDPSKPRSKVGFGFAIRMNDMNIIVPLKEPSDAIPLPNPLLIPGFDAPKKPTPETS